jgi:hypothetical protein
MPVSPELYAAAEYVRDYMLSRVRTVSRADIILAEDHNSVADITKKYADTMAQTLPVTPRVVKDFVSGTPTRENMVLASDLNELKTVCKAVMDYIASLYGEPYTTDSEWPSIYSAISNLLEQKFGDYGYDYHWNVPMKYCVDLTNLILRYPPTPPPIPPSTPAEVTTKWSVIYPPQVKTIFALGRYWIFFADGTNIRFTSSEDGETWAPSTIVRVGPYPNYTKGNEFSIVFDGTYFHYVYASYYQASIYYRRGTPHSDGTIDWQTEQLVNNSIQRYWYPTIAVDSNGYPWISYTGRTGTNTYYPFVIKSSRNDGIWATESGFPFQLDNITYTDQWITSVIALNSGRVYAIYQNWMYPVFRGRLWTGSWSGHETVSSVYSVHSQAMKVSAMGDDVHIAYQPMENSNAIIYQKRTYGSGWGSEETVTLNAIVSSSVGICLNTSTGLIVVFWDNINTDHIYYKKKQAGVWDSSDTDWIDESVDKLSDVWELTSSPKSQNGKMTIAYSTKESSPYKVRFAVLFM